MSFFVGKVVKIVFWITLLASVSSSFDVVAAKSFRALYKFGRGDATDANNPNAGLLIGKDGNLSGTSFDGGTHGFGTVFVLTPDGTETVLYSFLGIGQSDGAFPISGLIADSAGDLYGTTNSGGEGCGGTGCGVVFKLAPDATETVLHKFEGGADGAYPVGGLIADDAGNLYGTTGYGGSGGSCGGQGCGVVYKIASDGTETVLYAFTGGSDGAGPGSTLLADSNGNLYGTFYSQGAGGVFKLTPDGTETVIHSFEDMNDGRVPSGGLIADDKGVMYGLTYSDGLGGCNGNGCGTVYKLRPDGTETIVHYFDGTDGQGPVGELFMDNKGHLYGTSASGGAKNWGVIFKVSPKGKFSVLHDFCAEPLCKDGANPGSKATLTADQTGNLFGTTFQGGNRRFDGVVFRLKN